MKIKTFLTRISAVFLLVFILAAACFPLSVSAYTPEDFTHRDNKNANVPTTLIGSSDFEPLGIQDQTVWSLSSIKVYKSWWVNTDSDNNITDEFASWDFTDVKIDENGVSFTMIMYGDQYYNQIVRAPGAVPVTNDGFVFITVDGGMDDDPSGWISVGASGAGRASSEWYSSYDDSVSIGLSTTFNGLSARSHDFTSIIPEPQVGLEPLHFSVYSAYWGIDFIYTVPDPAAPIVQNSTSEAQTAPGEDSGVDIIQDILERPETTPYPENISEPASTDAPASTIAVTAAGALAAAGALGAGAGKRGGKNSKNKKEEEKKKKRYKMYVRKDFGDAIQKGAKAVYVYARVSEIVEGRESDCPEQTELIRVSGKNLVVKPGGIEGRYMRAEVSAPVESAESQGTVTFTLSGPGGVFRRNIIFRIIGEPRIAFPGDTEDGTGWDLSYENDTVEMVAGMGGSDRLRFVILDASDDPTDIRFLKADGFDIERENDPNTRFTYYACIRNNTAPLEKKGGIFGEIEERWIVIEAEFPGGLIIQKGFTVRLYPDGLSVLADPEKIENDRLVVDTIANPDVKPGYPPIDAVFFEILACYVDARTEKAVIERNPSYRRRALDDEGRYGLLFKENFEYEMNFSGSTAIVFTPKTTLPTVKDPYLASMKLIVEENNEHMEGILPFAFCGEHPLPVNSVEWQQAYERLKKDIRIFGLGNDPGIRAVLHNARDTSAAQLEFTRYYIILAGVRFYTEEGKAYQNYAKLLDDYVVIAGSMVACGDYAVEMILEHYFGKTTATVAGAFINPMKNLLATYIGTYYAYGSMESAPNFFNTLLTGCQDALAKVFTGEKKPTPKVLGYVISVYLVTGYVNHYEYGKPGVRGDIYRSVIAAFGDLAFEKVKAWLTGQIEKASKKLMQAIGNLCGTVYKKIISKSANEAVKRVGNQTFESGIRAALKSSPQGLSTASYNAVKAAREFAEQAESNFQNELMNKNADLISDYVSSGLQGTAEWAADSPLIGQILNYMAGGKLDGGDSLGLQAKDVIWNYLTDRFGLKVREVWYAAANPAEITFRLEDTEIILGLFGHAAAIPISENLSTFLDIIFSFGFSWMEDIWEMATEFMEPEKLPDKRDTLKGDPSLIDQQKQRLENLPSIEYKPQE